MNVCKNSCSTEVKGKAVVSVFSEMATSNPAYMEMEDRDLPAALQFLDGSVPSDSPLLIAFATRWVVLYIVCGTLNIRNVFMDSI